MSGKDELRAMRVGILLGEKRDERPRQARMEAGIQFVDYKQRSARTVLPAPE